MLEARPAEVTRGWGTGGLPVNRIVRNAFYLYSRVQGGARLCLLGANTSRGGCTWTWGLNSEVHHFQLCDLGQLLYLSERKSFLSTEANGNPSGLLRVWYGGIWRTCSPGPGSVAGGQ